MSFRRILALLLSFVLFFQMMPVEAISEVSLLLSNVVDGDTYYEVNFVLRGDTNDEVFATQYVLGGSGLVLPQNPAKGGSTFTGWYASSAVSAGGVVADGASAIKDGTTVNSDVTYVAGFKTIDTYTVKIEYRYQDNNEMVADMVIRSYSSTDPVETIKSPSYAELQINGGNELVYPEDTEITVDPSALTEKETVIVVYYYLPNATYYINHYALSAGENGADVLLFTETLNGRAGAYIKPSVMTESVYGNAGHYIFDHSSGEVKLLADTNEDAKTNNVINVYYVKDQYGYSVEYYYDGIKNDSKTEAYTATYLDEITTYTDKNITGYKLDKEENLPLDVTVNEEEKSARVIVPDYQLSLAIGKEGQNARLAARLTGYKIDIKSETQAREAAMREMEYEEEYVDEDME